MPPKQEVSCRGIFVISTARIRTSSRRGIVPTAAGEILAERSSALLEDYDVLIKDIRKQTDALQKELRLGIVSCGLMEFPMEWLGLFMEQYPGYHLVIREAGDEELEAALLAGELSAALLGGPVSHSRLEAVSLMTLTFSLMVREDSPLAGEDSVSLSVLNGRPLLLRDGRYRASEAVERELKKHGIKPSSVIRVQQRDMLYHLCLQGAGSSILLTRGKNVQTKEGVRFIPIQDFSQNWDLVAARKKGMHTEAEKALYEYIVRETVHPVMKGF